MAPSSREFSSRCRCGCGAPMRSHRFRRNRMTRPGRPRFPEHPGQQPGTAGRLWTLPRQGRALGLWQAHDTGGKARTPPSRTSSREISRPSRSHPASSALA
jgi:hypothetical protein